jgi:vancomycin resistance protein YoaR
MFRPELIVRSPVGSEARPIGVPLPARTAQSIVRAMWLATAGLAAIVALALAVILLSVRASHSERIFPAVQVADVPVGDMPFAAAAAAIADRAAAIEAGPITFTYGDKTWTATLQDIGGSVDEEVALDRATAYGREDSALQRVRSTLGLPRSAQRLAMPIALDYQRLDGWFDAIDHDLGNRPHDAMVKIEGTQVVIVPEVDGTVVDRDQARALLTAALQDLKPLATALPVTTKIAAVRAADLEPARALLTGAMAQPVQVSSRGGLWTLPSAEIARFLRQEVVTRPDGSAAVELGLDRGPLAAWLAERLGPEIETAPVDAEVGWDGKKLISVEPSVDGIQLDAEKLAIAVEGHFFVDDGTIEAPVLLTKPTIDSANLDKLGITTLLGSGQSNYSGSSDGRSANVAVGAKLLNGTLIPPWGEYSFNGSIGSIDEEQGFVEAQVIDGESIGQDIGGGICQVSTTVFRAAYDAGLPITEWWPHRFRIPFYEYDGWPPGLDASILQPTADPSTWADFRFENPSDHWMLVESWTDGINVVVNIYGADLGFQVESTGPTWGAKTQILPPKEVVDSELEPGTVLLTQVGGIGEELSHYRVVRDRNGELLWERSYYTKYYPRGDVWKVSPDMKGQAPIDPAFKPPPLPPAGIDANQWVPGMEVPASG